MRYIMRDFHRRFLFVRTYLLSAPRAFFYRREKVLDFQRLKKLKKHANQEGWATTHPLTNALPPGLSAPIVSRASFESRVQTTCPKLHWVRAGAGQGQADPWSGLPGSLFDRGVRQKRIARRPLPPTPDKEPPPRLPREPPILPAVLFTALKSASKARRKPPSLL